MATKREKTRKKSTRSQARKRRKAREDLRDGVDPRDVPNRPGKNGGMLKTGGTHAKDGRPPEEFRRVMRALVSSSESTRYLKKLLRGKKGAKAYTSAAKYASERGYGKVPLQLEGSAGGPIRVEVVHRIVDPQKETK